MYVTANVDLAPLPMMHCFTQREHVYVVPLLYPLLLINNLLLHKIEIGVEIGTMLFS